MRIQNDYTGGETAKTSIFDVLIDGVFGILNNNGGEFAKTAI